MFWDFGTIESRPNYTLEVPVRNILMSVETTATGFPQCRKKVKKCDNCKPGSVGKM